MFTLIAWVLMNMGILITWYSNYVRILITCLISWVIMNNACDVYYVERNLHDILDFRYHIVHF